MKWLYLLCRSGVEASIPSISEGLWSTVGYFKVYPRWFVRYEEVWENVVDVNHDIDDANAELGICFLGCGAGKCCEVLQDKASCSKHFLNPFMTSLYGVCQQVCVRQRHSCFF